MITGRIIERSRCVRTFRRDRLGFTLVEVTLAIFVTAVGLLAVYALFPSGLSMSRNAVQDTEVAFFAQEVFDGLHAKIDADTNAWANPASIVLEPIVISMWQGVTQPSLRIKPQTLDTEVRTNVYVQWNNSVVERAIRYNLIVRPLLGYPSVKYAWLRVWNGQFGTLDSPAQFYTEFYNFSMPPP